MEREADRVKTGPVTRLRRFLARLIAALLSGPAPAGGIVEAELGTGLADGVNYDLPAFARLKAEPEIAIPENLRAPERAAERQAFITEKLQEASVDFHFQFDEPYAKTGEKLSQPVFAVPLREWTWQARRQVLERAHMAYERNPLAKRAVKITTQFAVGEGLTVTYRNDQVEELLEAFRANPENCVEQYEKEWCNDLQVDGELFVRFFTGDDGQVVVVPLRPWEIAWIETDLSFIKRVKSYHRQGFLYDGTPGSYQYVVDDIPADEVLHVAINKHSYEQRGRSDLFDILPWLRAYKDWLEDRARQNHWRGSLLWHVLLTGAQPSQVAAKRAQYKQPPPPGSLVITNEKETWEPMTADVKAMDAAEDGRQIKLMSVVGKGIAEYMLGDGENANKATAGAQQLPALRTFGDYQDILLNILWRPIYRRVLEKAIAAGTLAEEVPELAADGKPVLDADGQPKMIKAVEAFDVKAPELESDDPKTLAEAMQIATLNEWASDETASSRMGFDYRVEQRKIEAKLRAEMEQRAQGLKPGPLPGQMPQFQVQDDGEAPASAAGGYGLDGVMAGAKSPKLAKQGTNGTRPGSKAGVPESEQGLNREDAKSAKGEEGEESNALQIVEAPAVPARAPIPEGAAVATIPQVTMVFQNQIDTSEISATIADAIRAQAPPVVNVINAVAPPPAPVVQVNVPEQNPPAVNVTVAAPRVELPPEKPETLTVERDDEGRITTIRKG